MKHRPAFSSSGLVRQEFSVLVHDIGSSLPIDGVIGPDFLHERELRIDFAR